ncbi:MAG: hypothetical protein LBG13_03565, partial [Holosporales bacterium]|nr:hypothetical protein [Holosporales bacterium]
MIKKVFLITTIAVMPACASDDDVVSLSKYDSDSQQEVKFERVKHEGDLDSRCSEKEIMLSDCDDMCKVDHNEDKKERQSKTVHVYEEDYKGGLKDGQKDGAGMTV